MYNIQKKYGTYHIIPYRGAVGKGTTLKGLKKANYDMLALFIQDSRFKIQ